MNKSYMLLIYLLFLLLTNCLTNTNKISDRKIIPITKKYIFVELKPNNEIYDNINEFILSTDNIKNYLLTDNINKANIKVSININKINYYYRKSTTITRTPIKDDENKVKDLNIESTKKEVRYLILETKLTIIDNNNKKKEVFDKSKVVFYEDEDEDEYGIKDYSDAITYVDDDLIENEENIKDFSFDDNTLYANDKIINKFLYERYKSKINNSIYKTVIDIIKKHIK